MTLSKDKLFFNQRIRDNCQRLQSELQNMSMGNHLILFHEDVVVTKYLGIVRQNHIVLPRSSNPRLAIESDRWHKPHSTPVDERK